MPLFDYKCPRCGTVVEVLVRSANERVLCYAHCGRGSMVHSIMERQPSAPAIHVKGTTTLTEFGPIKVETYAR